MRVYVITNRINGKQYVGLTKNEPYRRFQGHIRNAQRGAPGVLYDAMRKHGPEMFSIAQVSEAKSREELCALERHYIRALGTRVPAGYNMTAGGDGRLVPHTEEARAKMRASQKARWDRVLGAERLARGAAISAAKKGVKRGPNTVRRRDVGESKNEEFSKKVSRGMRAYIAGLPAGEMSRRAKCQKPRKGRKIELTEEQRALRSQKAREGALKRYSCPEQRQLTAERTRAQHARRRATSDV